MVSERGNNLMSDDPGIVKCGTTKLRPRARIIRALGEDLISNEVIALVELIKNSYDADAQSVIIQFHEPLEEGKGMLDVVDDGHGMTRQVLLDAWMEPATVSKRESPRSPKGRRVTGEKGIGRFAAARLGRRLHVESIAAEPHHRIIADLDWEEFRREDLYLDEIECAWREEEVGDTAPPGTHLRMEPLRDSWDEKSLRRLRAELSRLLASGHDDSFSIQLVLPSEFSELGGEVTRPAVLGMPHYEMIGVVDADGNLEATGSIHGESFNINKTLRLQDTGAPRCGGFDFELGAWDRETESLEPLIHQLAEKTTILDIRRDLNEACGISIYRDSFRVLPYGSQGDDWLRLDLRRVQNPTMRLSNNQIVGSIQITADGNPELRDQTNREGLVESHALTDLKECMRELLVELEGRRFAIRHPKPDRPKGSRLFQDLDFEPIKRAFAEKYPQDKAFQGFLDQREKQLKSSVKRVQEVLARYQRLATLGQLIDVVLHDGRTPVAAISNELTLAERDLERVTSMEKLRDAMSHRIKSAKDQLEVLSMLFRRIEPFGGRKRGRPRREILETMIQNAFDLLEQQIRKLGIRTALPDTSTEVTLDAAEMQQVFVNLLQNSLYWLEKVPKEKRAISVTVKSTDDGIKIVFADSGPGVPEEWQDLIFDPYFSGKPDGVGIGLTIVGEIVAGYDGDVELVDSSMLPGAHFRITLRKRVGVSRSK